MDKNSRGNEGEVQLVKLLKSSIWLPLQPQGQSPVLVQTALWILIALNTGIPKPTGVCLCLCVWAKHSYSDAKQTEITMSHPAPWQ